MSTSFLKATTKRQYTCFLGSRRDTSMRGVSGKGKNGGRPDLRDFPLISTQVNHAGQAVPLFPQVKPPDDDDPDLIDEDAAKSLLAQIQELTALATA
jgi:hypothetical protein